MKNIINWSVIILLAAFLGACTKDENNVDKEKPIIDLSIEGAFPVNCETIYFGEAFELKMLLTDNVELGSFSIDIHNNFNHHSHSTEVSECAFDPVKEPVNPYVFIDDYTIPKGLTEYETSIMIAVPSGNGSAEYDDGDYHFFIRLTDKAGWSTQKGLSVKMRHR